VSEYLAVSKKEDVWLLLDNLDKGWPVQSARPEDVLLLRSLLEASRKLERQFQIRGVECHAVVFIRNDIYEHMISETPDRGKETAVLLDWNDPEIFKEVLRRRLIRSTGLDGPFEQLWHAIFESHVNGEESFSYILSRTLMRPREVLRFARECVDVAVNRGHDRVTEDDILYAEHSCSDDALVDLTLELRDVKPEYANVPYVFIGAPAVLPREDMIRHLGDASVPPNEAEQVISLLLWFGLLGIYELPDEERYSHQFQHDLRKMRRGQVTENWYCVHPAFRKALACDSITPR
jgi:hypothetical protein